MPSIDGVGLRGEPRLADIRNRFGDRVADIVRSCSDSVTTNQPKEDWRIIPEIRLWLSSPG
jgi:hypothetical protein